MDPFNRGFVEILAAEQTPDNPNWYQGTADAVRQAARHFARHDADYYLVLAGDQLYRMNYTDLIESHIDRQADITIAAQPVTAEDAPAMGIFRFDRQGQIVAFEEKPNAARLAEIGQSIPNGAVFSGHSPEKPFVASMGIYLFSRDVLLEAISRDNTTDFGRGVIPHALDHFSVHAHVFRGYWADVGTVESFYDANLMLTRADAPFSFYDSRCPIYTHARFLPGSRLVGCDIREGIVCDGCAIDPCSIEQSIIGIRTRIQPGARISRSVLLGADYYESDDIAPVRGNRPRLGIGRDVVLDRVIVDKNARIGDGVHLTNAAGIQEADGQGYFVRNGIIIVPKDGVIQDGTRV
jgi:glucose-1-phosphate adenylyltransferase